MLIDLLYLLISFCVLFLVPLWLHSCSSCCLRAQIRLLELLLCSSTWMWEELKRDHVLYSFPPVGCAPLFPKHDTTAEERVAFSGILRHICNNNNSKIFWRLFMSSEDSWLGTTHVHRVKFLVSKSRVAVICLLEATFATWNPHSRSGYGWEEPCLVWLHCAQENADNEALQAGRG